MLKMSVENAKCVHDKVWVLDLPAHTLRRFGPTASSGVGRSIVTLANCEFDSARHVLSFDPEDLQIVRLGTVPEAVAVGISSSPMQQTMTPARDIAHGQTALSGQITPAEPSPTIANCLLQPTSLGYGDREFLGLIERELNGEAKIAAKALLMRIRSSYPGNLQKGKRLNFKDTPDNFWYVIVQPRAQSLSITVRGHPDRFRPTSLELKDDRGGYTRFSIDQQRQVDEAFRIISAAKKRY